jgi:hypothetical protein
MTGPFVEERIGDAPTDCGTEQTSWTNQENYQAGEGPTRADWAIVDGSDSRSEVGA